MRTVTEQNFVDAALADTEVASGEYHALQKGCIMDRECICNPVLEVLNDSPKKKMYWHRKHQLLVREPMPTEFQDPTAHWPFAPEQVEIVGDDKLINHKGQKTCSTCGHGHCRC